MTNSNLTEDQVMLLTLSNIGDEVDLIIENKLVRLNITKHNTCRNCFFDSTNCRFVIKDLKIKEVDEFVQGRFYYCDTFDEGPQKLFIKI